MNLTQDTVLEKLKNVIDPELFVNIVDLGLIYEIKLNRSGEAAPTDIPPGSSAPTAAAPPAAPQGVAGTNTPGSDEAGAADQPPGAQPAERLDEKVAEQKVEEEKAEEERVDKTPDETEEKADEKVDVQIEMTMTSPACPAGPQLIEGARREVGTLEAVNAVEVRIVLDPPWTPDRMTEDAKDQLGIF